jgi:hypothetical protein
MISEEITFLDKLRSAWRVVIDGEGGRCPCCDRWGKVYPRSLNETMAQSMIWLAKQSANGDWVDIPQRGPRWLVRSNQLPTLRWWGLVERLDTEDKTKKHSGFWRATEKGILFAQNRLQVPKKVYTYNAEVEGFSEELVTIQDCVDFFDYSSVMEIRGMEQ